MTYKAHTPHVRDQTAISLSACAVLPALDSAPSIQRGTDTSLCPLSVCQPAEFRFNQSRMAQEGQTCHGLVAEVTPLFINTSYGLLLSFSGQKQKEEEAESKGGFG